ncbi:MAG: hypothetical protein CMJ24_10495 [Phycisphaerae bacterium]|nr:hypothetical protein [Phycisphaerae bacterium]|tara:strand:- start:5541 stop:8036 length:2496 start_codon:yes stop_codon:yes gene_type:complete
MHRFFLLLSILLLPAPVASASFYEDEPASAVDAADPSRTVVSERLAIELLRYAKDIMLLKPITVESIEIAKYFLMEASRLAPGNIQITSRLLEMAIMCEDEPLIESASRLALAANPGNEALQLRRLLEAVDVYQHADERVAAFEILLSDSNIKAIGGPIASRLAFKLAMLHRRMGDIDEMSRWVGRSIALDPSFSEALAIGVGYFQTKVDDRLASVELLVSLMLADPTASSTPATLAHILMEEGAYKAANRAYNLAMGDLQAGGYAINGDLIADVAIAEWANGNRERALGLIQSRQLEADRLYREMYKEESSKDLSPLDLARLEAPLTPTLATVRAVIESEGTAESAADARSSLIETYQSGLYVLASQKGTEAAQAWSLTELAWLTLWLGGDVEKASNWIEQANALKPIEKGAMDRFDGWLSFRRGFEDDAARILEPLAESDPAARLGLALIREKQGRKQDAARLLLDVSRSEPGALIGIWSRDRLEKILGSKIPMTELAQKMTGVVDSIPAAFDRYTRDSRLALTIDIEPRNPVVDLYEPVILDIEVKNQSPMPLAISPEGPIKELMLIEVIVQIPHQDPIQLMPIIIDIGGPLRLDPYEEINVPFNLRSTWVGTFLNAHPIVGASIITTGIINFKVSNNTAERRVTYAPGVLGSQVTGGTMHIDGVRIDDEWVSEALSNASQGIMEPKLIGDLSVLTHAALSPNDHSTDELSRDLLKEIMPAVIESYDRMDSVEQAWFMSVAASGEAMNPIRSKIMQSEIVLPKLILLLRMLESAEPADIIASPMLTTLLRSDNERVKQLAEWVEQRTQMMIDVQIQMQSGNSDSGSGG